MIKHNRIVIHRIVIHRKGNSKVLCDECKQLARIRSLTFYKGKYYCTRCKQKLQSFRMGQSVTQLGIPKISLEEALNRVYEIKTYYRKDGSPQCHLHFSSALSGKKIKIVVVE